MKNWIPLSEKEYDQIWNKIDREFTFQPSLSIFPSFQVPQPFITYDVSEDFGQLAYDDLEEQALLVWKENTLEDEYIGNTIVIG
jgi:hypothetical protein